MPGFDPAAYRAEQRRGEPSDRRAAAPDPTPSAALAGIRADLAHLRACADAIPVNPEAFDLEVLMLRYARAVAAVEAVLKLHQPHVRRQNWPSVCSYDNRRWPCPEVEAITTALTGEEAGDGR